MAQVGLLSHHLTQSHHASEQSRRACSLSSVHHGHVLHAVPQHGCSRQHPIRAAELRSSGLDGCICSGPSVHHQQQQPCSSPLACPSSSICQHAPQVLQQQHQQHQHYHGGNSCSICGAAAAGSHWAMATCGAGNSPTAGRAASSLGWNAASTFFGTYRLGETVGHGSFGTVHRAVHVQTGNSYAVKVLRKSCGTQLDAIRREVEAWQQAQGSKYVAKLEGLFEDDSNAYIVQELCTGGTLRDLLSAKGTCTEQEAATIMRGVLDLLVECHRRQLCYGDLKPANIMFSGSSQQHQQVRAIDFGCSHSAKGRSLTQSCGSPVYMAPEVTLQRYTYNVDVWSAGVLLYQMLTGHLPFWPKKTLDEVAKLPAYEIVGAVRTYEIQFPSSLWADITPEARDLVSRMLDRDPATRISAAEALQHPWLTATLGYTPTPSSDSASANNVVEFRSSSSHSSPLRPVPLSPGKAAAGAGSGPLSPQKHSPLRSMLSGELPPSVLLADRHRQPMQPALVPAAE